MHVNPTMACRPPLDLGMLVRGIVVGDQVQWLVRGDLAIRKLPCQGDTSKGELLAWRWSQFQGGQDSSVL